MSIVQRTLGLCIFLEVLQTSRAFLPALRPACVSPSVLRATAISLDESLYETGQGVLAIDELVKLSYPAAADQEFLSSIVRTGVAAGTRELQRTETLARMGTRVMLARGTDIISDSFTYYSPATGYLNKPEFLGLLKVYDMALPDRFAGPVEDSLYACGDGPVAFVTQSEARFTGPLSLGPELSFPPTGRQVLSDRELSVVSFDADGLLLSLSTGIVVGSGEHDGAGGGGGLAAQIDEEERRVVAQEAKLESLKSQEGRAAYEKVKETLLSMQQRLADLKSGMIQSTSTTGGLGGLDGVLHAMELPASVKPALLSKVGALGAALMGVDDELVGQDFTGYISVPLECLSILRDADSHHESDDTHVSKQGLSGEWGY